MPSLWLLAILLGALSASTALNPTDASVVALAAVLLLGVPHGALDGEVCRPFLRRRFGRAWFLVFALPYLSLAGLVLVAWAFAPMLTLAGFLAASVLHFGAEDTGPGPPLERLVRGGLPIALPTLLHPAATAQVLATTALSPLAVPPQWLQASALIWLALAPVVVVPMLAGRSWRPVLEMGLLGAAFWLLPPLTAFAWYFVGLHAPRHMAALVAGHGLAGHGRSSRVDSMRAAILRSLPVTGLTLLLGAMLWPWYAGQPADRLLTLTLQGLAALTLPHLLLHQVVSRLQG